MQISGAMPSQLMQAEYSVRIQQKVNQTVEEQGKQALELIESAAAPARAHGQPGGQVDIVA